MANGKWQISNGFGFVICQLKSLVAAYNTRRWARVLT
jgi:hypothetical protein